MCSMNSSYPVLSFIDPLLISLIRLWRAKADIPDSDKDKMFGFVSVDCSPLLLGFPLISGWYNIIDWMGKVKGQIKITVKPNPFNPTPMTVSSNSHMIVTEVESPPRQPLIPVSRPIMTNNNDTPYVPEIKLPAESLSFMEQTLSKHLEDLSSLTTKLGEHFYIIITHVLFFMFLT